MNQGSPKINGNNNNTKTTSNTTTTPISKRNSGLFSFLRWFKPSTSRESVNSDNNNTQNSTNSGSSESVNSVQSSGTVASFSYVPPAAYKPGTTTEPKIINQGPETDTYKARLKQRDKRREKDKNTTLRKKYNLFFNRDTLLKQLKYNRGDENCKSLPLMTRTSINNMQDDQQQHPCHRRTASESSKLKKAGAYCHVKGKRKAPQPPHNYDNNQGTNSMRRKKRLAPQPPPGGILITQENIMNAIEYADADIEKDDDDDDDNVIYNDSLKLEYGILKPAKEDETTTLKTVDENITTTSARTSSCYVETPVSPRPWYKRNANANVNATSINKEKKDDDNKLPEVSFTRNSTIDLLQDEDHNKENKRKSGLAFLTNISELDREASRIVKEQQQQQQQKNHENSPPLFMKSKDENVNMDTLQQPNKRRSARDLIAKFNAITNVTKVTVNSAFFGNKEQQQNKKDYFGRQISLNAKVEETIIKKEKEQPEKNVNPLMKSESASIVKSSTPRQERKNWNCPKCTGENEYWRIICHVCSTIKPYFDDLSTTTNKERDETKDAKVITKREPIKEVNPIERNFERSKTQIGFSILTNKYKQQQIDQVQTQSNQQVDEKKVDDTNKKEEREKLKKMLIEMKNSLPKKKHVQKQIQRKSIIQENPETSAIVATKGNVSPIKHSPERSAFVLVPQKITVDSDGKTTPNDESKNKKSGNTQNDTDLQDKCQTKKNIINNENKFQQKNVVINVTTSATPTTTDIKIDEKLSDKISKIILPSTSAADVKNTEERIAEIIIATTETVYENIKVKKTDVNKPIKVSSSVQTSGVIKKTSITDNNNENVDKVLNKKPNFELLRPKDFANIYSDKTGKQNSDRIYANLAENDDLSLFFNMPKKFNDIKIATKNSINTDTIEINRLLKRLENAIAKGEMSDAAIYARELAQLKVNCSVIRQRTGKDAQFETKDNGFTVDMYVEDKISHRGPFPINVKLNQTVAELKIQIERDYEIPRNVQRWILGKELAVDDNSTLKDHHVTVEGCPIFLYLVAPTTIANNGQEEKLTKQQDDNDVNNAVTVKAEDKETNKEEPKVVSAIYKATVQVSEVPSTSYNEPQVQTNVQENSYPSTSNTAIITTTTTLIGAPATAPPSEATTSKAPLSRQEGFEDDDDLYDSNTLKADTNTNKEWTCAVCTLINSSSRNVCEICDFARNVEEAAVESPKTTKRIKRRAPVKPRNNDQHYMQLVNLDNEDLVENLEPFECPVCFMEIEPGNGVTLRECIHQFCKECLAHTIEYSDEAEIKCPYRDDQYSCDIPLQDREIKALVTKEVYEQHLAKSVAQAENKIDKSFHCKTPDCRGWCIFEDNVNEFKCPVCKNTNCLTCQAIHAGLNCKQYQEGMNQNAETDEDAKRTREMLDEMVRKGEALVCPACKVILMKKWGCDWVRCSMCKTEICWVTRGPRWGPGGKGDTSGGCKCGVNGVKCHPQCNYCH